MPQPVRVPDEIYAILQQIKFSLDPEYMKAAPSIQDMVNVALKRFIEDWEHPDSQTQLLNDLLEQRQIARSRMGNTR
ncbi:MULTISPECIES: hypothetical protein [unclassified Tolypothrix]|uniref:hypothetical protein n=1 Tax=unclassified Tolypothrix TaxID=2649714 RepID=UPI0005F85F98|nr:MULTISPECIES: hypothetical protein [unclassified Tolypothrix]MBE9082910.1 hypothetical protein [Tolypothrix sp. LEGE 11397]UYD24078.1 hypothetical protein HGR01_21555 [Tolypothrix sp. PCC 7712]UYD33692.1 hypothetical protein HG267_33175 [Tolypothrix sp. PCC 7601]